MNLDLSNKRALVSGSTAGIGKAIAKELALMGANVTLLARDEIKLKNVIKELNKGKNQKHDYILADFSQPNQVKQAIDSYLATGETINILINNTGGPAAGPIEDATTEAFQSAFSMHLINNHNLVKAVKQGMIDSKYGRIINIISTSVKIPLHGLGVSNTVRAAVANWSKTLANELGQYGITVNNVLPGATATERLSQIISNKMNKTGKSKEEIMKSMEAQVPMNRVAQPEEVANAAAFLASPAAGYINGINIPVDGGRTACL